MDLNPIQQIRERKRIPFDEVYGNIINTGLICPQCEWPIFHCKKCRLPEDFKRQAYICSCAFIEINSYLRGTLRLAAWQKSALQWSKPNDHQRRNEVIIEFPSRDYEAPDRSKMQRKDTYDPSLAAAKSRAARWGEACRIAGEALQGLLNQLNGAI